jgi:hypothetical protein
MARLAFSRRRDRKRKVLVQACLGAARGAVATVVMSVPMLVSGRRGDMGTQPPKRITETALDAAGADDVAETGQDALSIIAHLGFGASMGALFSLVRRWLRPPGPVPAHGVAWGLLVWATSYKGWLPALGLLPSAERDQPRRRRTMLLAHVVYGGALGLLESRDRCA